MRVFSLGLFALLAAACTPSIPRLSFAVEQRLLRETTLDDATEGNAQPGDGVVRLVHLSRVSQSICSGAVIGPRQILTAQHCVTSHDSKKELTTSITQASDLHVELGGGYLPWGRASVVKIHACDGYGPDAEHDLAVVVLKSPLPRDVPIFDLDYDEPDATSSFHLAGFGFDGKPRVVPFTGSMIIESDRHVTRGPLVHASGDNVFVSLRGVHGDSGGPIVDTATGKIVSIASRAAEPKQGRADLVVGPRLSTCKAAIDDAMRIPPILGSR